MPSKRTNGLYTVIYPFMAGALQLKGLVKECFAVIFGFWFSQNQNPVSVSLNTFQSISGGTRSSVVKAIHKLEEYKFIVATRKPGKKTVYDVTIPEQVLKDFKALYTNELVKRLNDQGYPKHTSTSMPTIHQNNIKEINKTVITPLKVKPACEIRAGGLKEA